MVCDKVKTVNPTIPMKIAKCLDFPIIYIKTPVGIFTTNIFGISITYAGLFRLHQTFSCNDQANQNEKNKMLLFLSSTCSYIKQNDHDDIII